MADIEGLQRKFEKELASGTVSLVLLAVLGRASEPLYGYPIAKALEQPGGGVLAGKQSALYPVLGNLEGAGLLDSHIEPSLAGPPRRYYRINDDGRQVLAQWTAAWNTTRDSVQTLLQGENRDEPACPQAATVAAQCRAVPRPAAPGPGRC